MKRIGRALKRALMGLFCWRVIPGVAVKVGFRLFQLRSL